MQHCLKKVKNIFQNIIGKTILLQFGLYTKFILLIKSEINIYNFCIVVHLLTLILIMNSTKFTTT